MRLLGLGAPRGHCSHDPSNAGVRESNPTAILRNGIHHTYLSICEGGSLHSSLTSNPHRQPPLLPHLHSSNRLRALVGKTTPNSEMARGFMDVRRAMEAMEGAYPNDLNRSILSLNKRPKGEIPPRVSLWHECRMQGLP
jgi:hypothetical protein